VEELKKIIKIDYNSTVLKAKSKKEEVREKEKIVV